jgi:hypothetical protein
MLVARHGGGSHFVRPDQVYRTGVIQPIGGYSPQQDVMDVAASFTQGPYMFQQGQAGFSGPVQFLGLNVASLGPLQKLWLKFQVWRTKMQAKKFGFAGLTPYGPAQWAGGRVVPGANDRAAMLIAMQQKTQPEQIAFNNSDQIAQRWNAMRSSTR